MHLSYCTNVHPAEDLEGVLEQLDRYAGPVRRAAGLARLGVGLWLPAALAHRLAGSADDRARLREALDQQGLEVRTLNAFPYRGFHAAVVKHAVYSPTWADPARLAYTLACAEVLADLLPDGAAGSISTLPLAWRSPWTAQDDASATAAFGALSAALRDLTARTGRVVRVAVEPEPGCVLDTVADVTAWLRARLSRPTGSGGAGTESTGAIDPAYVGVCLDTCHLAVSFAGPADAVRAVTDAGLRVVKVQASAALHLADPSDPRAREAVARFADVRYLHQVRELTASGAVVAADDLPEALGAGGRGLPGTGPWRVHFHVPLHHEPAAPLSATTDVLREAVAAVRRAPYGDEAHLDVETYTWSVLPSGAVAVPPDGTEPLVAGIADELRWAVAHLPGAGTGRSTGPGTGPGTGTGRRVVVDRAPATGRSA